MPLHGLPNELVLRIAWFVLKCTTCHCHHVSHHLSALTRSSQHLHSVLTPELLRTASMLQILLWAIAHSRQDTVTLAINHGADPNVSLRETHSIPRSTQHVFLGTALDVAFRLRTRSIDPAAHQPNLATCTTLLRAGGKPTIESISPAAESGDVDLLRCCLLYISDINAHDKHDGRTLLEVAGSNGHVGIVTLLLAAGAIVNSSGLPDSPHYFPPLWKLCGAPLPVLLVLLAAGADAAWEHAGQSVVGHLLENRGSSRGVDRRVYLLTGHGARVPKREGILLWQAPVWELWTGGGGELEEQVPAEVVARAPRANTVEVRIEYHGWEMVVDGAWDEWGPLWRRPELEPGCMCPVRPLATTGGYRAARALVGWVPIWWGYGLLYQTPVV